MAAKRRKKHKIKFHTVQYPEFDDFSLTAKATDATKTEIE